jgi:DNA-binding response OmpR family regulator
MDAIIGLLTENTEVLEDSGHNCSFPNLLPFKSFDSIKKENYSVFLIDIEVFESDDLVQFFLSKMRKRFPGTPVLLITRVNTLMQINFNWFFDDYILYPFRKGELDSRIKKLIRLPEEDENIILIGQLMINLKEYSVYMKNQKLELTYKEFELLRLLVENRGEVFSRKDLLNRIWGMEYIGGTRTVDVHIRRLRGKLGEEFNSIIETVRNVGYRCK